ncbi:hypothetical protein P9112_000143 [Eukaryota sp. TZLM1-RC]
MSYPDCFPYLVCNSQLEVESVSTTLLSTLGVGKPEARNLKQLFPSALSATTLVELGEVFYRLHSTEDLDDYKEAKFLLLRDLVYTEITIAEVLSGKRFVLLANDVTSYQKNIHSLEKKVQQLSEALDSIAEGCCIIGDYGNMDFISLPFQQTISDLLSHVTHVSQYQNFPSLLYMLKQECCTPEKLDQNFVEEGCTPTSFSLDFEGGCLFFRVFCSFHYDYFYKILFIDRIPTESTAGSTLPIPQFTATKDAETPQEIKDHVLSSVFHHLKTPLFGIYSSLELIEPEKMNPELFGFFQTILGRVDVLSMHIHNVLEVSQLKASLVTSKPQAFFINCVIDKALDFVSNMIQTGPVEILTFTSMICQSVLEVDHYHLERILVCLLTNAVQNTYSGHMSLQAQCISNDGYTTEIKFIVEDTGIGIPCKYRPYIFEPFVSIPDTVNRTPGLGLGLTIAKLACDLLNSELSFQSNEDQGTSFCFTLKLPIKEHLTSPLEGKSVLLISDQQIRFDSVAAQLREWHMTVHHDCSCSSLSELSNILKRHSFDICVLDKEISFLEHMVTASPEKMFHNVSICFLADLFRKKMSIASLQAEDYPVLPWPVHPHKWIETLEEVLACRKDVVCLPPITPTVFHDKLVICAEDNEISQRLLQLLLQKRLGCNVIMVENGFELCSIAKKYYSDIFALITDLRMPKMGGREAIASIREWEDQAKRGSRVPIIALSAEPSKVLSDALQAGATFILRKPLSLDELTKIMTAIDNEFRNHRYSTLD